MYQSRFDQFVSGGILKHGIYEGELVELIVELLRRDEDLVFVDIGANVGTYALSVAKLGRTVVAVEPFPPTHYLLCKSIKSHKPTTTAQSVEGEHKIYLINNALSNSRQNMTFDEWKGNIGGTKVKNATKSDTKTVESILLDDLLNIFKFGKVIMKMDIERHEQQASEGAVRFFQAVDVKVLLMEWKGKSWKQAVEVHSLMKAYGMEPHHKHTRLLIPDEYVSGVRYWNYYADICGSNTIIPSIRSLVSPWPTLGKSDNFCQL